MRNFKTLLPVFAALALFTLAQFFIVRQVWLQKDEVFDLRYRSVAKEAIQELAGTDPYSGFSKAYYIIDDIAPLYTAKLKAAANNADTALIAEEIRANFREILSEDQLLTAYLSKYFSKLGLENKISPMIYINHIDLIDISERINVYKVPDGEPGKKQGQRSIQVHTFKSEGNNYRISFDYYIDIGNKEKIILREISFTLMLSIISFIIISLIYLATMRNYLEEKRLSGLKTDFINNMTHELKTPLSTITVAGKTLKHEAVINDKKKITDTANMIGKQSVHLNKLINNILEISMWERTQFQIDKKETDMGELIGEIADNFSSGCGEDCVFTVDCRLKGTMAEVDTLYFTTMINNLLNNAVKYSKNTAVVHLEAYSDKSGGITVKVSDRGIGISRSQQKNIFDKFYRVGTGNIHSAKGLGLGLYYVKKIAEAHGGSVSVSSKKGKGSVFIVNIP
ncbi:MAG: sensor histidine kinase [Bacteroidales bacterium]